jgi:hypothetical protein
LLGIGLENFRLIYGERLGNPRYDNTVYTNSLYLAHWVARWPRFFAALDRLERTAAHLSGGWGDHYIMVLTRADR